MFLFPFLLQLRRFLLDASIPASGGVRVAPAAAASTLPVPDASSRRPHAVEVPTASATGAGDIGTGTAAATAGSRRRTAPTVLSTVHEPVSPTAAAAAAAAAAGLGVIVAGSTDEEGSDEGLTEKAGDGGGGGSSSWGGRGIPSLRPELKVCRYIRVYDAIGTAVGM